MIQLLLSAAAAGGRIIVPGNPAVLAAAEVLPIQVITLVAQRRKEIVAAQRDMDLQEATHLIQAARIQPLAVAAPAQLEQALVLMRQHLATGALAGHRQLLARQ